jgi:hypothetical protein
MDMDFNTVTFDILGLCVSVLNAWSFFPNDTLDSFSWYAFTGTYPTCDLPMTTGAAPHDIGWVKLHCYGEGEFVLDIGYSATGAMGMYYTNGATAQDYDLTFHPVVVIQEPESGVKEDGMHNVPKVPFLASAKPSLFSGSTSINYGITKDEHVSLKVYNAAGQVVRTLVNDDMKAGSYTASWNGRDDMGRQLSSGVYFTTLNTESFNSSRKIVLR